MFTKCKDVRRLDPEKGVNKLFENVLCKWRIKNIFQGGGRGAHFVQQSYFKANRYTKTAPKE